MMHDSRWQYQFCGCYVGAIAGGNIISVAVYATGGGNIISVAFNATVGGNIIFVALTDTCFPVSISSALL